MNSNQILQCLYRLAKRYNRPNLKKWVLKKNQQRLHKGWGWS